MLWQIQGRPPKKEEKFEEERVRQPSCTHAYAHSHQQPRGTQQHSSVSVLTEQS